MENVIEASADDILQDEQEYEYPDDISETVDAVLRVQKGPDPDAWTYLFNTYYGAVYAVIIRRLRNTDDAHETTQHVFQRAFSKIDQLREPKRFAGWIKRIAIHLSINHAKRTKKVFNIESFSSLEDRHGKDVADKLIGHESTAVLHKIISLLNAKDRDLIHEFYFNRRSLKELSAEHDAPLGTIKRRLFTARQRLRDIIQSCHPELVEVL
jgi:RNA polymerase sigma-70 factor, ECF subfamily